MRSTDWVCDSRVVSNAKRAERKTFSTTNALTGDSLHNVRIVEGLQFANTSANEPRVKFATVVRFVYMIDNDHSAKIAAELASVITINVSHRVVYVLHTAI